jgi:hypothetical protein
MMRTLTVDELRCLRLALGDSMTAAQKNNLVDAVANFLHSAPDIHLDWPIRPEAREALKRFFEATKQYRAALNELSNWPTAEVCLDPRRLRQLRSDTLNIQYQDDTPGRFDHHAEQVLLWLVALHVRAIGKLPGTGENSPFVRLLEEITSFDLPGVPPLTRGKLARLLERYGGEPADYLGILGPGW